MASPDRLQLEVVAAADGPHRPRQDHAGLRSAHRTRSGIRYRRCGDTCGLYQETAQPGDPASWRTDEFDADWGLGAIAAEYAYARGLTGAGIALGQFDTGVERTHPEFAGRNHVAVTE